MQKNDNKKQSKFKIQQKLLKILINNFEAILDPKGGVEVSWSSLLLLTVASDFQPLPERPAENAQTFKFVIPICGPDGHTHGNKCEFDYAKEDNPNLEMKRWGECNKANRGSKMVPVYPICGSDGRTYGNESVFNYAKKRNPNLKRVPRKESS